MQRTDAPHANKFDVDIDGECLLERDALVPAGLVGAGVHLIREWHLLVVACRQESNLVYHACEGTSRVRATRESEEADLVARLVCFIQSASHRAYIWKTVLTVLHKERVPLWWKLRSGKVSRTTR